MIRTIDGFHQDDEGDWVAELSCLHNQHVRHQPPFRDRPWVTTSAGRDTHVGSELDCPLCDRAELPPELQKVRTAGPFDAANLPAALQRSHVVADRTWGCLRVLEGSVHFTLATVPPLTAQFTAGASQPIPPGVAHVLEVRGPVRVVVDFLVRDSAKGTGSATS